MATLEAYDLRTEHRRDPLGIDAQHPRLAWRLRGNDPSARGVGQGGFRIRVQVDGGVVWDSGRIHGSAVEKAFPGELAPRTRYEWTLEVWDAEGVAAEPVSAWFETGLLDRREFRGEWIARDLNWDWPDAPHDPPIDDGISDRVRDIPPVVHLRREFEVAGPVARARIYATARGVYRLHLNGRRVGDHELAPGWTDYDDRIQYQTFDVTDDVRSGSNAIGIVLADGWWSGYVGFDVRRQGNHWGVDPEAWAMVVVEHPDGSETVIATDGTWRESSGEILYSDLLMGESVDRRRGLGRWTEPGFDDSAWAIPELRGSTFSTLVAEVDEPVRVTQELRAVSVDRDDAGRWIYDFGQVLVGRVRLELGPLPAGHQIALRHGEMLDDGRLYTANLRTAEARDVYVSAGAATDVFEPQFTFHGFRYVEIDGLAEAPDLAAVTAVVLQSGTPRAGELVTSSRDVNQLISNIEWGQRGNFLAVPTDCPQRDERLGWLADAQVFLPTAAFNADVQAFFARWLRDVRFAQTDEGSFPSVVPRIQTYRRQDGAPGWGDAGVIIPWHLYRVYGDRRLLEDSYASMVRWVDFVELHNPDLIWTRRVGSHYGDWLQIDAITPRAVLATAYFARSAELTSRAAKVLGRDDDADRYARLAARIRSRFQDAFVTPDGRVTGDTQTCYLLALAFDLVPDEQRAAVAEHLVRAVESHGRLLTTGFIGVSLLCPVLTEIGRSDLAFELLETDRFPSWLYSVRHGATTIWERWDGWTEHAGFQAPQMNSFNHYSLGSVGEWLYRHVAGIDQHPDSVGYERLRVAPQVGGTLDRVAASYESPRGRISTEWRRDGDVVRFSLEIPPGVEADVVLPAGFVVERGAPLAEVSGISEVRSQPGTTSLVALSGSYEFGFTPEPPRTTSPTRY